MPIGNFEEPLIEKATTEILPEKEPKTPEGFERTIEDKEGKIKANVFFFFGEHAKAEDVVHLREHLLRCDVFVPELGGWEASDIAELQEVANGDRTPDSVDLKYNFPEFETGLLSALYRTNVKILPADLSMEDLRRAKIEGQTFAHMEGERNRTYQSAVSAWGAGNPEGALLMFQKHIRIIGAVQRFREAHIIAQLKEKLQEIQGSRNEEYPSLLRVMVHLGSVHTSVFHAFASSTETASAAFSGAPLHVYAFYSEALRRAIRGKEVDNDLAMKAIVEGFIFRNISPLCKNTHVTSRAARHLVEEKFEGRDQEIPRTKEELHALIASIRDQEIKKYGRSSLSLEDVKTE